VDSATIRPTSRRRVVNRTSHGLGRACDTGLSLSSPGRSGIMYASFLRRRRPAVLRVALAAALVVVAAGATVPTARGGDPPACPSSTDDAYQLKARALTGKQHTDISLSFTAAPGCGVVGMVKHVQIKTFDRGGNLAGVVNFDDVRAQDGVVLDRVARGLRIEAE